MVSKISLNYNLLEFFIVGIMILKLFLKSSLEPQLVTVVLKIFSKFSLKSQLLIIVYKISLKPQSRTMVLQLLFIYFKRIMVLLFIYLF